MSPRLRGDDGAATIWMILGTIVVLAVAGLVFDGGLLISAKRQDINDAEAAARAGAQGIDINAVYTQGPPHLDPTAATQRAQAFLAANGWTGTVTADATTVTVTVTSTQHLTFLSMFGLGDRPVAGTASAQPNHGLATH